MWLKLKNYLSISWAWIKGNILAVLMIPVFVFAFVFAKKKDSLSESLLAEMQAMQAQNHKQIEDLRKIHQDQLLKQQAIDAKYREVVQTIEVNYQQELHALSAAKETELKALVAANQDDPEKMAQEINQLLGLPIYRGTTP